MQIIKGDLIVQEQNFHGDVCCLSRPHPAACAHEGTFPALTRRQHPRAQRAPDGSLQGENLSPCRSLSARMLGHGVELAEGSPATHGQRRTETDARWVVRGGEGFSPPTGPPEWGGCVGSSCSLAGAESSPSLLP